MSTSSSPARVASSTTYWMAGLSTTGSISFGVALVAGRKRVPRPATGTTAFVTPLDIAFSLVVLIDIGDPAMVQRSARETARVSYDVQEEKERLRSTHVANRQRRAAADRA